jgi:HEAT repeat protein
MTTEIEEQAMRPLIVLGFLLFLAGCAASTDDWLGQLKDPEVVKRREAVRELAAQASEAPRVVPALTEALRDTSPYVRHDAALALAKFSAEARAAVPALTTALKDQDRSVRVAAGKSLKKIDAEAAKKAGLR